jgi:hypothetical protein
MGRYGMRRDVQFLAGAKDCTAKHNGGAYLGFARSEPVTAGEQSVANSAIHLLAIGLAQVIVPWCQRRSERCAFRMLLKEFHCEPCMVV